MEALRIVCAHTDNTVMMELKALKRKQKRFEAYMIRLHNELDCVLRTIRSPDTRDKFDEQHDGLSPCCIDKLWETCTEKRKQFPELFRKITFVDSDDDEDDNFDKWCTTTMNRSAFDGVIGGLRSLTDAYENIYKNDAECPECGCEGKCLEHDTHCCECCTCGDCVYTKCECDDANDSVFEDITRLRLNLDTSIVHE